MDIHEYLAALKSYQGEKEEWENKRYSTLTLHHGIYDNWAIFLNANFLEVIEHFETSPNAYLSGTYRLSKGLDGINMDFESKMQELREKGPHSSTRIDFSSGTVVIQALARVTRTMLGKKIEERHAKVYNMTLKLHPEYEDEQNGYRDTVKVIDDLCTYGVKRNITFCLPNSIGWSAPQREQNIIYYPSRPSCMDV